MRHVHVAAAFVLFFCCISTGEAGIRILSIPYSWYDISESESAVVLLINKNDGIGKIIIEDGEGKVVSQVNADTNDGILRQFRVVPGDYSIVLPNGENVDVTARPASFSYVSISLGGATGGASAALYSEGVPASIDAALQKTVGANDRDSLTPTHIDPNHNVLYISTDPPFEVPGPPPKK
jgi:hypothetical protein